MLHPNDDDLVLHYYGERETAGTTAAHLASCGECRQRFVRLERVLAAVDTLPDPALPEGFERTVWARLEPALPERRRWTSWLFFTPAHLAWAATVVLLVTAAFFAGRVTQPSGTTAPIATAEQIREGVLLTDLTEHLHRSQAMLVELVSAGAAQEGTVDISLERDTAQDLVAANRLYRQTLAGTRDAALADLLEDLERLLVELAASPDELSPEDLERVRQRVTARDLLFKVRVVSGAMQERQQQQIRVRAGQSS